MSEAFLSIGRQCVGAFFNTRVEKIPLNMCIQWNAGTACVSECVLKALACRGLRVGPSKGGAPTLTLSPQARLIVGFFQCSETQLPVPDGCRYGKDVPHKCPNVVRYSVPFGPERLHKPK